MMQQLLLIIHILCVAIWVGGHIFIAVRILPKSLRQKNPAILLRMEKAYEPIGMPALLLLVITGVWMATLYVPISQWFSFSSPIEKVISIKLLLLFCTLLLALSAQFRVIPKLKNNAAKLHEMAFHIITVTFIAIVMLILGTFIRFGGL